jgi:hypothetical protein
VRIRFDRQWELTNERSESSYGMPVLVDLIHGQAFGPGDLMRVNRCGKEKN